MSTVVTYLRLSNEDIEKGKDGESESIRNQRNLLNDYLDHHSEFQGWERMELCDDGWSGTNFDRPGMQQLLRLVKRGSVQCILVKDFSRFGRDYLTTGNYITRVLPFLGVRFLSLGDGYDSADPSSLDDLSLSFSTILHDLYSKELSGKVKSAKDRLAREGMLSAAPFGYRKDPKGSLLVDPESAETVRRIFAMVCAGQGTQEVARKLNHDGVLTPLQYKRSKGCPWRPWTCVAEENFWTGAAVLRILRNECYLGRTVYGKRRRAAVGDTHTVSVPRSEWIVADNIHEAIVSEEQFYEAQERTQTKPEGKQVRYDRPLAGKVSCSCCGHRMRRNRDAYFCGTPSVTETYPCPRDRIPEEEILTAVLTAIQSCVRLAVDVDQIVSERQEKAVSDGKQRRRESMVLQSRKSQTEQLLQETYEGFVEGSLTKESCRARTTALSRRLSQLSDEIEKLQSFTQEGDVEEDRIGQYKSYPALDSLAGEHIRQLLEQVTVYPDRVLQVRLSFRGTF